MANVSQLQAETNQTIAWFNTFLDNTRSRWFGTSREAQVSPIIMGVKAAAYSLTQNLAEAARTRPDGGLDLDQAVVQFKSFAASSAESIKSLIQTPAQRQQAVRRETAPPGGNVVVPAPDAGGGGEGAPPGPSIEEQLNTSQGGDGGGGGGGGMGWLIALIAFGGIALAMSMRKRGGGSA